MAYRPKEKTKAKLTHCAIDRCLCDGICAELHRTWGDPPQLCDSLIPEHETKAVRKGKKRKAMKFDRPHKEAKRSRGKGRGQNED